MPSRQAVPLTLRLLTIHMSQGYGALRPIGRIASLGSLSPVLFLVIAFIVVPLV